MGEVAVAIPAVLSLDNVMATSTIPSIADRDITTHPPLHDLPLDLTALVAQLPAPLAGPEPSPLAFADLPTELHLMVFSSLDPIDSTCLGLTSRQMYNTYRRVHHKVPLNSRRQGRNKLEGIWHGASTCRFCTTFRCELHMHIAEFFPERYEYCHVRQVFGLKAKEGMGGYCYRHCPPQPDRCGRHRVPKTGFNVEEVSKL